MTLRDDIKKIQDGETVSQVANPKSKTLVPVKHSGNRDNTKLDRVLFCRELIKHGMNATQAYQACRPQVTAKTAAQRGYVVLRELETVKVLAPMLQALFANAGIEADYVFRRWLEMSLASPLDYFTVTADGGLGELDLSELTPAQRGNLKEIKVTRRREAGDRDIISETTQIKVVNQQHAVDAIAKHLGLLVDRLDPEDVERIGDLIEQGVNRIKKSRNLDGWKDVLIEDAEYTEA